MKTSSVFDTLRRDLESLVRRAAGRKPAPYIRFPSRPERARPSEGREMRVVSIARQTPDAVSIRLEPVEGVSPEFVAGQFLSLALMIDGLEHRRAYSICSSPSDRQGLTIGCKRVAGGRVSNYLCDRLRPGDVVRVLGPSGAFIVRPDPNAVRRFALIAGGSGITPLLSIARAVLELEPTSSVTLLYANRDADSVMFRAELDALVAQHPARLRLAHVFEIAAAEGEQLSVGRLDRETFEALLPTLVPESSPSVEWFLCGPEPMMDAIAGALRAKGISADAIRRERFTSAPRPTTREAGSTSPRRVVVRIGAATHKMVVAPGQTVLEAATARGVPIPFSCALGGCGSCRVRVVSGEVEQDEPNCLLPRERADGLTLACIARPRTDLEIVVPDATPAAS